jgi:hypothetical protein
LESKEEAKEMTPDEAAKQISDYLTTGMHHATPEGMQAVAEIIRQQSQESSLTPISAQCIPDADQGPSAAICSFPASTS